MKREKTGRIKSDDHGFDLWFFGALMDEAVRLDNVKGFNNLIDSNPDLAGEYFRRRMEKIERVKLMSEFDTEEWTGKMLSEIHQKIKERGEKQKD